MTTAVIRKFSLLTLLCVGVLVTPARAQECNAPPGTAAVEQYCETVPEATGNRATRDRSGRQGETRDSAPAAKEEPRVSDPTLEQIESSGPQGRQLGRVLRGGDDSRPKPAPKQERAEKQQTKEHKTAPAEQRTPEETSVPVHTGNAFSAVGAAVSGGDTVGGLFGFILLTIAGLIGGVGFIRRGRGGK